MERGKRGNRRDYRRDGDSFRGRGRGRGRDDPSNSPIILSNRSRAAVIDDNEEEWPSLSGQASATSSPSRLRRPQIAESTSSSHSAGPSHHEKDLEPGRVRIQGLRAHVPQSTQHESSRPEPSSTHRPAGHPTIRPGSKPEEALDKGPSGGIQVISEGLEWHENAAEFLLEQNTEYLVIGVIGPQGAGKSTLLSMIGGNDPFDMYRQYIFRPASREAAESCKHQTCGIQMFVTKSRTILLDCQPCSSHAILDDLLRSDKRYNYEFKTVENYVEVESLELASFILQVSHVVLVVSDWFLDLNLVRFLRTAEMLKPPVTEADGSTTFDRYPSVVFVHHKAKLDDFQISTVKKRSQLLERMFKDSNLNIKCSISLANCSYAQFSSESLKKLSEINYFLLPELKLRGQKIDVSSQKADLPGGLPEYEVLIKDFREIIRSVPRPRFLSSLNLTEKAWFLFAAKMWSEIRKSPLIVEYGRTIY